ncbi:hypothetical protein J6590_066579 [Homalodisca vitripennis]|nr:hypothetical protein J6590_066579 [Homalodisca vitripennis]
MLDKAAPFVAPTVRSRCPHKAAPFFYLTITQDEQYEVIDEEIVNIANGKGEEDDDGVRGKCTEVSHCKGHKALQMASKYAEQLEEISSTEVLLLRRLQDLVARKRQTARKKNNQTFFTQA